MLNAQLTENLAQLSAQVGAKLRKKRLTICTVESLTAGLVANALALTPGASKYLVGSIVAYQERVKRDLLKVEPTLLLSFGAVHPEVAWQMAKGAVERLDTDCCIATTGFAGGLTGGTSGAVASSNERPAGKFAKSLSGAEKPDPSDGLVYICIITPQRKLVQEFKFCTDGPKARTEVMQLTCQSALKLLMENL